MLWRLPGDDPKKGVGAFARVAVFLSDRNLVDLYADAGINFMGCGTSGPMTILESPRPSRIFRPMSSSSVQIPHFSHTPLPLRNYELAVELTYQAQIVSGWIVQPDFQYIFHPGGGTVDPLNTLIGPIPDAAVFGVRTQIRIRAAPYISRCALYILASS